MEPENNPPNEVESINSSASPSEGIRLAEGLYRLTNEKARTLLDLGGGKPPPIGIIGFNASPIGQAESTRALLVRAGNVILTTEWIWNRAALDSVRHQQDGSPVFAYNYVEEGSSRLHQEWNIVAEGEGFYTLQCAKTGTYLEIQNGNSSNGAKATCSKRIGGGDHQLWDLERASRTTLEIKSILRSWKPDLLSRLFQPHDDGNEYFILPSELRNTIWNGTKLLRQEVRRSTFDYDAFVIKAKDAVTTWVRDRQRVDGLSVLFGIVFGEARKGPKAYNWYLSPDMQSLVFFDAQTGLEYTTAGLENLGFEPSFAMF